MPFSSHSQVLEGGHYAAAAATAAAIRPVLSVFTILTHLYRGTVEIHIGKINICMYLHNKTLFLLLFFLSL